MFFCILFFAIWKLSSHFEGGGLLDPLHPGVDLQLADPLQRRQEQIPPLHHPLCHGHTCFEVLKNIVITIAFIIIALWVKPH